MLAVGTGKGTWGEVTVLTAHMYRYLNYLWVPGLALVLVGMFLNAHLLPATSQGLIIHALQGGIHVASRRFLV